MKRKTNQQIAEQGQTRMTDEKNDCDVAHMDLGKHFSAPLVSNGFGLAELEKLLSIVSAFLSVVALSFLSRWAKKCPLADAMLF